MAANFQTLQDVFDDVRDLSNKDSNTLKDANLLRLANKYYLWIVRNIIDLNEDLYAEIASTDLVANQKEYPLPVDDTTGSGPNSTVYGGGLIKIQRVEINYSSSTEWTVADPISWQSIPLATILNSDLNAQFDKGDPKYAFKDRSIFIVPVPVSGDDVGSGNANLFIYYIKRPNELTATTDVPDLPKDFLNVLSEGMLKDVYRKFGRTGDARDAENRFQELVFQMRELAQAPDTEQRFQLKRQRQNYK